MYLGASFVLIFIVAYSLLGAKREMLIPGANVKQQKTKKKDLLDSIEPLAKKLTVLNRFLFRTKIRDFIAYYKPLLAKAGARRVTPEHMVAYKEIGMIMMLFLGWLFRNTLIQANMFPDLKKIEFAFMFYIVVLLFGFVYPDNFLKRQIAARQKRVVRNLPYLLDLMVLGVEAGIPLVNTIQNIIARSQPGDLIDEFNIFLGEINLGGDQIEALHNLAARLDIPYVSNFVREITHAIKYGKSLGTPLRDLAVSMRTERFLIAEKAAAQAAVKLMFPLVVFIFPVVIIVVGGPAMIILFQALK